MRSFNHVDTTQAITHLGLCAGYGGIELGLKRIFNALRTVAFCEIEAFACANLVAKMEAGLLDAAPIWSDLKTFPWAEFSGKVDILTGGYPCQPFSAAGKRLGTDDHRHLWPYIANGIRLLLPKFCFFENVEGHISLGLREVVEELERLGYKATWGIFSACEVGAPHQRKRVFILGVNNCKRLEGVNPRLNYTKGWQIQNRPTCIPDGATPFILSDAVRNGSREGRFLCKGPNGSESFSDGESWGTWPSRPGEPQHEWEPPRVVADAKLHGRDNANTRSDKNIGEGALGKKYEHRQVIRNGQLSEFDTNKWQAQSSLGGNVDGAADRMDDAELYVSCDNRTDELRLLGNGVVPDTAERAFVILAQQLELI